MVHKKSEYMLQFHKMSKDLRRKIYMDNIQFREFRRMDNAADHYWSHQLTDDKCECENESSNDEESSFLLPPAYKLKHKALVNTYNNSRASAGSREIAVQTPDWLQQDIRPASSPPPQRTHSRVNTDPEIERSPLNRPSNPTPPPAHSQSPSASVFLSDPSFRLEDTPAPNPENLVNTAPSGILTSERASRISATCPTLASREPLLASHRTSEREKTPESPSPPKSVLRASSSHFAVSPTRTSRKLYSEGRKTHFVPYGWNDKQSEIGQKKTHNVCAPDDQVYATALDALRLRRAEVERQLALEAERRRKLRGDKGPINHSSIWMTEYRDKFRQSNLRNPPSRPHTSPAPTRPSLRSCVAHSTCHRPISYGYS